MLGVWFVLIYFFSEVQESQWAAASQTVFCYRIILRVLSAHWGLKSTQ